MPEFDPTIDSQVDLAAPPTLVEQFYNPDPPPRTRASANLSTGWAQTFTATSSFTLSRAQFPLGQTGGGEVTLLVTGITGSGAPDPADVLATRTISIPGTQPWVLFDFDLHAGVPLTSGSRYALCLRGSGFWQGQYPGGAPAVRLYYNWDGWLPFPYPAAQYFLLFEGDVPPASAAAANGLLGVGGPDSAPAFRMHSDSLDGPLTLPGTTGIVEIVRDDD